jgi:hypothetical protein
LRNLGYPKTGYLGRLFLGKCDSPWRDGKREGIFSVNRGKMGCVRAALLPAHTPPPLVEKIDEKENSREEDSE